MKYSQIELYRTGSALSMLEVCLDPDAPGYPLKEYDPVILSQEVRGVLNWAWLKWHLSQNRAEVSSTLEKAVGVVMKTKERNRSKKVGINDRGELDHFLMAAALLSGNATLARKVAATVTGGNAKSKSYQYDAALAGVMAASMLGDDRRRDAQLAQMKKYKPTRVNAFPSPQLVNALVGGGDAELNRAIAASVEKYWSDRSLARGSTGLGRGGRTQIVAEEGDRIGLDLNERSIHWMWPYMEAAFARLAMLKGRKVRYDDFWFPLAFVTGADGEQPASYTVRVMPEEPQHAPKRRKRLTAKQKAAFARLVERDGPGVLGPDAPKSLKKHLGLR